MTVRRRTLIAALIVLAVPAGGAERARGHETDQYTLPTGREFADLRYEMSDYVRGVVQRGVERLNARIRSTLDEEGQATPATERHYAPESVASAVFSEFPLVLHMVEQLNLSVLDAGLKRRYPGLVTGYIPGIWIYSHALLVLDVTKLPRLSRSAMLQIDGVLLGTDKIVHFVHMGYLYYGAYGAALKRGGSEAEAVGRAVALGTGNHPILSERTLLGELATGVFSNADLAADYAGLLFYRNLTEEVRLKGRVRPPLLIRDGPYWRLNDHVRGRSDFFADFVSPHWNEALNPCVYGSWTATIIRAALERRCDDVLRWYARGDGSPRTREEFQAIHEALRRYDGVDYGAEGDLNAMVTIANTCFSGRRGGAAVRRAAEELWEGVRAGDASRVARALAAGADANGRDPDGERPLHAAARRGHVEMARMLLERGAEVNAATVPGLTPLHVAVRERHVEVTALLLASGAPAGAVDAFGRAALHDAAARGDRAAALMLLAAGAGIDAADGFGTTPLHLAARHGRTEVVEALIQRGANTAVVSALGRTPADEAGLAGHRGIAEFLRTASARSVTRNLASRAGPRKANGS